MTLCNWMESIGVEVIRTMAAAATGVNNVLQIVGPSLADVVPNGVVQQPRQFAASLPGVAERNEAPRPWVPMT